MTDSGLANFKNVLVDFSDLGALALKFVVAAPFVGAIVKFGPPPAQTVSVFTCVAEFLTVMWCFHFWSGIGRSEQDRRMKIAVVSFCTGLALCLAGIEMFTVSPGPGRDRVVEGFWLQNSIKPLIGPAFSTRDALAGARYDASEVWNQSSIVTVHVTLIVLWLVSFVSLAVFVSMFVIARRERSKRL